MIRRELAYLFILSTLAVSVLVLAGQWSYVFYRILVYGSYTMAETDLSILIAELVIALLLVLCALGTLIWTLRR